MSLFLALLGLWLLLQQSVAAADVLTGIVVALLGTAAYRRVRTGSSRPRCRPWTALALAWLLLDDIVRSNVAVARIVLGLRHGKHTAGFLELPLELRDPRGLAILACIVTATPGTSWARYDAAQNAVTIHVLDLVDGPAWIREFKARYERRLLEIFP